MLASMQAAGEPQTKTLSQIYGRRLGHRHSADQAPGQRSPCAERVPPMRSSPPQSRSWL